MKITIDTSHDSNNHIKHAIALLQNVIGIPSDAPVNALMENKPAETSGYVNIFAENSTPQPSTPEPAQSTAETPFFNIFGEDSKPTEPSQPQSQVIQATPIQPEPQAIQETAPLQQLDRPSVQTTTPIRAPPQNAPPEVDMFDFFSKAREKKDQIKPY